MNEGIKFILMWAGVIDVLAQMTVKVIDVLAFIRYDLSEYAVITQNDESAWDDIKGDPPPLPFNLQVHPYDWLQYPVLQWQK